MKLVNLMTKTELVKAYKALPYVIHKNKFLIPQRPFPPTYNKVYYKKDLLGSFKRKYPEMVTEQFREQINDEKNHPKFIALYLQKYEEERLKYYQQIMEYSKKYILPLKQLNSTMRPQFLYFRIHSEQIRQRLLQSNQKYDIKVIYQTYRSLPQDQKRIYEQKVQQFVNKKIQTFIQACKLYEIPNMTVPRPNVIYLREVKQEPITKAMLGELKQQPDDIKKLYKEKFRQLKEKKKEQLLHFLNKFNLSQIEFEHIKDVCAEIKSLKAAQKRLRITQKKVEKSKKEEGTNQENVLSAQEGNKNVDYVKPEPRRKIFIKSGGITKVFYPQELSAKKQIQATLASEQQFAFDEPISTQKDGLSDSASKNTQLTDLSQNLDFINDEAEFSLQKMRENIEQSKQNIKTLKDKK